MGNIFTQAINRFSMDFVPLIQIRGAKNLGRLIITKIVYLWKAMRPVFRDLANPELLKKCLHGGTQNPNESVNNVIWSRVPKKTFVQLEVLSLGTYDAVSSFNMGNVSKLEILRKMCIEPGDYTVQAMECLDKQRLLRAKYYCLQKQRKFVEWAQNEIAVVPDFHKRILFSDEAHFWLNGYVNKQNCRIWSEANPQVYVEKPLHPEKLTVWCALWAGGIIGPYFFKNDEGHNVTVNGDRYRAIITNFFIPELNTHDVQELWFQQDGATCHTARATIDLLKDTFGDRLISRFGSVNWPPRSCDLTPLDYFLWGYVKSLVYADKPQTLDSLEDNIRRVIADIRPQMLESLRKLDVQIGLHPRHPWQSYARNHIYNVTPQEYLSN
ncbi:putative transposase [Trichonephila clavipes]|nr:putative transposase [Trichonephila clavipes]